MVLMITMGIYGYFGVNENINKESKAIDEIKKEAARYEEQ